MSEAAGYFTYHLSRITSHASPVTPKFMVIIPDWVQWTARAILTIKRICVMLYTSLSIVGVTA